MNSRRPLLISVITILLTLPTAAQPDTTPLPDLKRNTTHDLTSPTTNLTYHLRIPAAYNPKTPTPAILILHGSNMNAKAYVNTIAAAWPKIASDYVLIGINGEKRNPKSPDNNPAYNYTYINFVGKGSKMRGFPGSEKESPALVTQTLEEIKKQLPLGKIFIGGHSQGGWLTVTTYMHFPELFAGAFPVAGGMIVQAEPTAFNDEAHRAQQRRGAIAVVYGQRDTQWASAGKATYESFADDGFPALRLFAPPQGDHRFALLPVDQAIRWLESITSNDPARLLEFAQKQLAARQYRDAHAAATRAKELDTKQTHTAQIETIVKAIETLAQTAAQKLEPLIKNAKDDSWLPQFTKFRADFEFTQSARPILQVYNDLREKHEKPAANLWTAARKDFAARNPEEGYKRLQELTRQYYASTWYRHAKSALDSRAAKK